MLIFQLTVFNADKSVDLVISSNIDDIKQNIRHHLCDFIPRYFVVKVWKNSYYIDKSFTYTYSQDFVHYSFESLELFFIDYYLNKSISENNELFNSNIKDFKKNLLKELKDNGISYSYEDLLSEIDKILDNKSYKFKISGELTKNEITFYLNQLIYEIEQVHNINNINKSKLTKLEIEIN